MKLYETLTLKDAEENGDKINFNLSHYNLFMNISIEMSGIETSVNLDSEQFYALLLFMHKELEKHKNI